MDKSQKEININVIKRKVGRPKKKNILEINHDASKQNIDKDNVVKIKKSLIVSLMD